MLFPDAKGQNSQGKVEFIVKASREFWRLGLIFLVPHQS